MTRDMFRDFLNAKEIAEAFFCIVNSSCKLLGLAPQTDMAQRHIRVDKSIVNTGR